MRLRAALIALTLLSPMAQAEEGDLEEGAGLLSQGAEMLLRGLLAEIEPALRDIEPRLRELGPFLLELEGMLPDIDRYHLPEMLPNGDIIIRRKDPLEPEAEGEIEL
jgi:hypothetical protein